MAWSREHGARSTEHGRAERLEMTLWVILVKEPVCRGGKGHPPVGGQVGQGARGIRQWADKWSTEHGARSKEQGARSTEQGAQSKEH